MWIRWQEHRFNLNAIEQVEEVFGKDEKLRYVIIYFSGNRAPSFSVAEYGEEVILELIKAIHSAANLPLQFL